MSWRDVEAWRQRQLRPFSQMKLELLRYGWELLWYEDGQWCARRCRDDGADEDEELPEPVPELRAATFDQLLLEVHWRCSVEKQAREALTFLGAKPGEA